jgi:bacterioferritin (cytochrome b1)
MKKRHRRMYEALKAKEEKPKFNEETVEAIKEADEIIKKEVKKKNDRKYNK